MFLQSLSDSPGRGMCMPGKGTRKGGTMTGGKAGMAAVGWATLWGRAAGSRGTVWTAVTGDGTVETVTTVTGDTATVDVTVATGARSATTVADGNNKKFKFSLSARENTGNDCWFVFTCNRHRGRGGGGGVRAGGVCVGQGRGRSLSGGGCSCSASCSVATAGADSCSHTHVWTWTCSPRNEKRVEFRLLDNLHTVWFTPGWLSGPSVVVISLWERWEKRWSSSVWDPDISQQQKPAILPSLQMSCSPPRSLLQG